MEKVKKEKEELLSDSNRISLEYKTKLKQKFKILHKRVREAQIETEETLRHIRAGKCAWLPEYKKVMNKIDLWKRVYKHKLGLAVSKCVINRLIKTLELNKDDITTVTKEEALENLKKSYKY